MKEFKRLGGTAEVNGMKLRPMPSDPLAAEVAGLLPLTRHEASQLAEAACRYTDGVTPRQAAAYATLFASTSPTVEWLRGEVRRDLKGRDEPEVKGITATYMAMQDLLAQSWPARSGQLAA